MIAVDVGGQAVNVPADAKSPALRFDAAEHRVSGSTGCNNLTGSYTQTGAALTFSPLATTRMMCPEPFAGLETSFLAAMTKTASYTIDGSTLTLRSSAGEALATFKAAASGERLAGLGERHDLVALAVVGPEAFAVERERPRRESPCGRGPRRARRRRWARRASPSSRRTPRRRS